MLYVFNKKQMYDSVITGRENASRDWNCIISMFLTSFNTCSILCLVMNILCVYVLRPLPLFCTCLGQGLFFLVKTGWQPKLWSKLLWARHRCSKLCVSSVGCHNSEKVGKYCCRVITVIEVEVFRRWNNKSKIYVV